MSRFIFLSVCQACFYVFFLSSSLGLPQSDSGIDLRPKKTWWGRYGYVNSAGKFVLEPQFEDALPFADFLAPVKKGGLWGFINRSGKFLVEPRYENAAVFRQGLAAVQLKGKWGFIDKSGEMVISARFEQVYFFQEDRCGALADGKWGFIDRKGEFVITPKYDEVLAFAEGLAAVNIGGARDGKEFQGGVWKFVNPEGKEVISEVFVSHTAPASTSTSRVGTEGRQDATAQIQGVEKGFSGGKARILLGSYLMDGESRSPAWGYIDSKGNWLAQGAVTIPLNFSTYTPGEGFTFESDVLGTKGSSFDIIESARRAESIGKTYEQAEIIEREADEQTADADRVEELGDKEAAISARKLSAERRLEARQLRKEADKQGGDSSANSLKYFEQALKIYQEFAKNYPEDPLRDEALYKTGEMLEHLARYWDAYEAYKKLVEQTTAGRWWDPAIERIFSIGNVFLAGQPQMLWKIPMPADMNKVVKIYETILRVAPFGPYAPLATFSCGLAREKQKKWPEAVRFYEEVLDKYPKNDLVDDAQYQIGFVWMKAAREPQYDQTAAQKGIEAFQDYLVRFKRSDKTDQASENIEVLKQRLSGGSLSVARFYDKSGNYQAALVYYNEVLSQTPDSPQGQEAKQRKRVLEELISETKQTTAPVDKSKISLRHQAEPRTVPPE